MMSQGIWRRRKETFSLPVLPDSFQLFKKEENGTINHTLPRIRARSTYRISLEKAARSE